MIQQDLLELVYFCLWFVNKSARVIKGIESDLSYLVQLEDHLWT